MPVEGFDSRQELAVVATRDENLCVRTDSGLKYRKGPGGEFVFFKQSNLVLSAGTANSISFTDSLGSTATMRGSNLKALGNWYGLT